MRKLSSQHVSLVTIRDQYKSTLNLAKTTGNKMVEIRMNLKNVPTIDMMHLHRETCDIIYTDLLKATLQVSKLQSSKKIFEDLLRNKVENKANEM